MAGPDSLRNLSNLDIIRLTKDIDRDEYYRLGGVLGFGEDILDHLWDPAQKGSALKVVLLWRDGLEPEVDQRAILGEKLSQAGLDDKWEYLLSGLPASPVASKSANSTRLKGSNAPVLPMKQSKQGNNGLHPSAVTERSDMIADSRPDEHNGKDDALPILLGITDDSDDSDGENYINVSNETLRKGSASIASVCSKPRLPFHSSEEINIPEERQSCLMESQPVVPPSKVSADSTTWVNDDQFQSQHDSGDKEAVKQSETEQDHDLQKSSTFNENLSIANSKSDPAETLRPVHAKPKIPVKPSRGAIDPMVLRQPVVNEKPNQPDDPQNNSEALQNTPIKDDKAQPSSSQPNTTLLNDEDVSMNVPSTDNTDGHKEADIAPLVSSDTMKLQGKLSTSVKDSYLLQTPVTQASTIQDDPRSEVGNGHQEPSYASTTAQLNSQGPPVAPYQTRSPVGPSISSSPEVPSIKHVPVTHSSSVTANRLTQLPGTLPKSLSQKGAHDAQSEPDRHFQRVETLPNKPMETTLDPSMNKQKGSSFLIQQGLNEDVLRALAGDITTGDQLRKLGLELGFKEADINGFEAMNHRTTAQSMEGTFDMLLKWKSTVSGEDQSLLLKHALRRSNLVKMADSHLKTTKRRRGRYEASKTIYPSRGGTIQLPHNGISLCIPALALQKECKITVKVLPKPSGVLFAENEAIVSPGVVFEPSGTTFALPLKLVIPHCAVLTDPSKAKVTMYVTHGDKKVTKEELSLTGTPRCVVRKDDLEVYINHFSMCEMFMVISDYLIGKRVASTPFLPKSMSRLQPQHCHLRLYNDTPGLEDLIETEEEKLDYRKMAPTKKMFVLWEKGELKIRCEVDSGYVTENERTVSLDDIYRLDRNVFSFLVKATGDADVYFKFNFHPHYDGGHAFKAKFSDGDVATNIQQHFTTTPIEPERVASLFTESTAFSERKDGAQIGSQLPATPIRLDDKLLYDIAEEIETDEHLDRLMQTLVVTQGSQSRCHELNRLEGRLTARGTRQMLMDWRARTAVTEQRDRLKDALTRAGLLDLRDRFFPG